MSRRRSWSGRCSKTPGLELYWEIVAGNMPRREAQEKMGIFSRERMPTSSDDEQRSRRINGISGDGQKDGGCGRLGGEGQGRFEARRVYVIDDDLYCERRV